MNVFEFNDFRDVLKAYLKGLPRQGYGETNKIAEFLRVHASFVSQVMKGSKSFNLEQARELTEYLGLGAAETDYFIYLVELDRAGSKKLKDYWRAKLETARKESLKISKRIAQDRELTDIERATFYSSWIYSAVRLYTSIGNGKTLDEIATRYQLSRKRAGEILGFLTGVGLCREEKGRFVMGAQRTHLGNDSVFLPRVHLHWRTKSMEKADTVSAEEMMFSSPISISRADFAKIREDLVQVIQKTSERVKNTDPEDVALLNLDLLWLR